VTIFLIARTAMMPGATFLIFQRVREKPHW
jgi:hypothetical protein